MVTAKHEFLHLDPTDETKWYEMNEVIKLSVVDRLKPAEDTSMNWHDVLLYRIQCYTKESTVSINTRTKLFIAILH